MPKRASLISAAALSVASAAGASIGLNLGVNGEGNVQAGFLLPADEAGAPGYEQANWINLGRYGSNAGGEFAVTDSSGADTGIIINWDANNIWSVENTGTPTDQGNPQVNLMNAYIDSNGGANVPLTNSLGNGVYGQAVANKPLVYFSGVSDWLSTQGATQYDLVIYADGDVQAGRTGEYWLQNASGAFTNIVYGSDLTTHVFLRDFDNFVSSVAYQQVPLSSDNGRVARSGNYIVFTGLTADSFVLRTAEFNTRSPINALQIVPRTTPVGPTLEPLLGSETYAGATAALRVTASGVLPMTFQWRKDGAPVADGGSISGATTSTLTIANASAANQGNYSVVVSNAGGATTSTTVPLTVLSPAGNSYAEKIFTNNPVAFWRFNEDGDPTTNNSPAYDVVGGFHGVYGPLAQNGTLVPGPAPADFPGFEAGNTALRTASSTVTPLPYPSEYVSWVVAPALNLNTNVVTMAAWIYPTGPQAANAGILFERGAGNDVNGFGYGGGANLNRLSYTWNNQAATYNFASGLVPATNEWSFVACVVTASNAVLYLYNENGQFAATNTPAEGHTNAAFAGLTMIGVDPSSTGTPQDRAFTGSIDEVAVFDRALTDQELYAIFKKGLNVGIIPAGIAVNPVSAAYFEGRDATLSVVGSGDRPLSYEWRKNGAVVADNARISGSTTPDLILNDLTMADQGSYTVSINNIAGVPAVSTPVTLSVIASNAAPAGYEAALRRANPVAYWRLNETTGTVAHDYWGGNIATHTSAALDQPGPSAPDFVGFETDNNAVSYDGIAGGTDTGVSYLNNRGQFSIVGWFNPAGVQLARAGLFGQNDAAEFGFHGADIGIWTPNGGFASFAGQGQDMLVPGQWYFIAATGDGAKLSVYLLSTNLTLQTSVSMTTTNYGASSDPFRIGGGGILDATGNTFLGQIDEVAVFDRALSADEVAGLYGAAQSGGALPPSIANQPASAVMYAGRTAQLTVNAVGSEPLQYQWRRNGVNLSDGGNISGATGPTLTIAGVSGANSGDYDVVITNPGGSVTSGAATLNVIVPSSAYETVAVGHDPLAYWRLNELEEPSTGTALAHDYVGGLNGTYGAAAQNGANGIVGPRPAAGFDVFETTNMAVQTVSGTPNSFVTIPPLGIATNVITITAWINPSAYVDRAGIVFARSGQPATGLNFIGTGNLNYHWLDTATTYGWDSGLNVPLDQWSFVALVVEPTRATMYLKNANGSQSAVNNVTHAVRTFSDNIRIGGDPSADTRTFTGTIDEVAVYPYALSAAQLDALFQGSPAVSLEIQRSGDNITLSWPNGILLEASEALGPYSTNNASSPFTTPANAQRKFYRVLVK